MIAIKMFKNTMYALEVPNSIKKMMFKNTMYALRVPISALRR